MQTLPDREVSDIAIIALELSQVLEDKWDSADISEKRAILEILCLNYTLNGVSLCYELRKPFDIMSKGLNLINGAEERI